LFTAGFDSVDLNEAKALKTWLLQSISIANNLRKIQLTNPEQPRLL